MACARLLSPHLGMFLAAVGVTWGNRHCSIRVQRSKLWGSWENKGAVLFPDSPRAGEARPSGWWRGSEPGIGQTRGSLSPRIVCSTSWFGRRMETTAWMNGLCPWGGHLGPC